MALTAKHKLFAETYLANGFNALEAYNTVFGGGQKNKPSYPYTLLKKPEIAEYLEPLVPPSPSFKNLIFATLETTSFKTEDKNIGAKLKALELLSKNLSLQTQKTENKDVIEVKLMED